jgi:cytochrome o ubiquinol oxidase subunit 2
MHFEVQAVPAERFAAWLETTRGFGPTLDDGSYATLAKQSMNISPFTFAAVEPELFHKIVTQQLPPGPGPQAGLPDLRISSPLIGTVLRVVPDRYAKANNATQRTEH